MAKAKSSFFGGAPAEPEADAPAETAPESASAPVDHLDAPAAPEAERPAPEQEPEPNPLTLVLDKDGNVLEVVMFNPLPVVLEPTYNGQSYRVRPKGYDLVALQAANNAVGPDNSGGPLLMAGLRRLYGAEEKFEEAAKARGLTGKQFAEARNAEILATARAVGAKFVEANPLLAELESNG